MSAVEVVTSSVADLLDEAEAIIDWSMYHDGRYRQTASREYQERAHKWKRAVEGLAAADRAARERIRMEVESAVEIARMAPCTDAMVRTVVDAAVRGILAATTPPRNVP